MKLLNLSLVSVFRISLMGCKTSSKHDANENTSASDFKKEVQVLAQKYFASLPVEALNPQNPANEAKIKLGKILYFDQQLSKNGNISCNSCHNLNTYGVDNLSTSPGDDGTLGTRNSPTVLNAAFHTAQFWDGRAKDVEEQAGGPILNAIEMGMPDEQYVMNRIEGSTLYKQLFAAAFPGENNPLNYLNLSRAIGAFERTLITPSPFDAYLNGDVETISEKEAQGLKTYVESGCIACHKGALLGGDTFQKFALFGDYRDYTGSTNIDKGKAEYTQNPKDEYIFKTPSLRNIEKTYPYFHDGSVTDLKKAIEIMAKAELNRDLNKKEIESIYSFLKTLNGDLPEEVKAEPVELKELYL